MIAKPHVVFAGGGSLGNLYPGLAIARRLAASYRATEITFAGSGDGLERHAVTAAGFRYLAIPSKPSPRSPLECFRYVADNTAGYWASRWALGEDPASLVVGLGGEVSAIVSRAARSRGVPLVLFEKNARPSRTAKQLGSYAEAVCVAFDDTQIQLPVQTPVVLTGTPARDEFICLHNQAPDCRPTSGAKQLVIVAGRSGSQARSLNASIPPALARLREELRDWRVFHQSGEGQLQITERHYRTHGVDATVVSHIDDMASLMEESDLAISRSGGSMLAELTLAGLPAVVVPHPKSLDARQAANAEVLSYAGGCVVVDEQSTEPLESGLVNQLRDLLSDQDRRASMSEAQRAMAQPNAGERVAGVCAGLLGFCDQPRLARAA